MYEDEVLKKLDELNEKMDTLLEIQKSNARDSSEWVDKEETMKILKCSERSLQTLRDNDLLGFTNPLGGSKFFYKRKDVESLFEKNFNGFLRLFWTLLRGRNGYWRLVRGTKLIEEGPVSAQ